VNDAPAFLERIHKTVRMLANGELPAPAPTRKLAHVPAVSVRKSLASRDHIISMIDCRPYKTLKKHLAAHGLTPAEYCERYGLRPD
jgi:predicted transcriptional regulator